ncbi:MAG: hypothetical protein AAFU80_11800 [Pseudomonadota bacterium]
MLTTLDCPAKGDAKQPDSRGETAWQTNTGAPKDRLAEPPHLPPGSMGDWAAI